MMVLPLSPPPPDPVNVDPPSSESACKSCNDWHMPSGHVKLLCIHWAVWWLPVHMGCQRMSVGPKNLTISMMSTEMFSLQINQIHMFQDTVAGTAAMPNLAMPKICQGVCGRRARQQCHSWCCREDVHSHHCRKVRSLAKKVLGSTRVRTSACSSIGNMRQTVCRVCNCTYQPLMHPAYGHCMASTRQNCT